MTVSRLCMIGLSLPATLFAVVLILFLALTGPGDLSAFPPAEESPYLLPWPEGVAYLCVQGVRGVVSHRGASRYAYDFAMPVGADISAARAGEVTRVVMHHDGNGYKWPNNVILVRHDDGTAACYAHIKKGGSYVAEGDIVEQGQIIGAAGNVGNSMMPHLHFHVTDLETRQTLPITFADVSRHAGIPRMFRRYTSRNPVSIPGVDPNPDDNEKNSASGLVLEKVLE